MPPAGVSSSADYPCDFFCDLLKKSTLKKKKFSMFWYNNMNSHGVLLRCMPEFVRSFRDVHRNVI